MSSKQQQYLAGMRAGVPIVFGFIPVGVAYALMARQAGLNVPETILMSVSVFAGASQMMAAGMIGKGAGFITIVIATFIMNLRHIIMSTCVFNRMQPAPMGLRLAAAFGVTDESFGIFSILEEDRCSIAFFLGMITVTYSSWVAGTALGAVFSGFLPAIITASLSIALYALFIGILAPNLGGNIRLVLLVILAGGMNAVLSRFIDSNWALIIATLVSAFLGLFFVDTEEKEERHEN